MKLKTLLLNATLAIFVCMGCGSNSQNMAEADMEKDNEEFLNATPTLPEQKLIKMLSLGDSYTIGESVCDTCRFPEQLKTNLKAKIYNLDVDLKVIATTGWTTSNLIAGIASENLKSDYDLATLLIGVNNQFQGRSFELFETEFPELVHKAVSLAKGVKKNLVVISIPDYAFTPFGLGNQSISKDIDKYNNFIEDYCTQNNITYIYITDITREGLQKPELVAFDNLHPSTLAYSEFVRRILPEALEIIENNTD